MDSVSRLVELLDLTLTLVTAGPTKTSLTAEEQTGIHDPGAEVSDRVCPQGYSSSGQEVTGRTAGTTYSSIDEGGRKGCDINNKMLTHGIIIKCL